MSKKAGKKSKSRLIKVECPYCGYIIRVTRRWLDVAIPNCPACEVEMKAEPNGKDK